MESDNLIASINGFAERNPGLLLHVLAMIKSSWTVMPVLDVTSSGRLCIHIDVLVLAQVASLVYYGLLKVDFFVILIVDVQGAFKGKLVMHALFICAYSLQLLLLCCLLLVIVVVLLDFHSFVFVQIPVDARAFVLTGVLAMNQTEARQLFRLLRLLNENRCHVVL